MLLIAAPSFGSMSTTPVIDTHLASEVAALRQLVNRMLHLAESAADQSQTIPEFCSTERISRAFYYEMRKAGRGPREPAAMAPWLGAIPQRHRQTATHC